MPMRRLVVLVAAASLAFPAASAAKGWITFSAPRDGVTVGEAWDATLRFPLHPDGLELPRRPELVFTHFDSYEQRRFHAARTPGRGVYRARVALPLPGRWIVYVYAREIGSATPGPGSREVLVRRAEADPARREGMLALGTGALGLGGVAALILFARRRSRRSSG